jgi:hypothetical protein
VIQRLLFLDIDGVLNSTAWFKARPKRTNILKTMSVEEAEALRANHGFDPVTVSRLNSLVERADCDIVISSTWRKLGDRQVGHEHMQRMLKHRGFKHSHRIIGATPSLDREISSSGMWSAQPRGLEIAAWLAEHGPAQRFVILDDESDMEHLAHHLIQTSFTDGGLLDEHVETALAYLTGPRGPEPDEKKKE